MKHGAGNPSLELAPSLPAPPASTDTSAESSLSRCGFLEIVETAPGRLQLVAIQCGNVNLTNSRYYGHCKHQRSSESVSLAPPSLPRLPVARTGCVPDLDQPLQLLVHGIRRTPVFLHREIVVQGSRLDRSDITLICTSDRMILVVASEGIPNHVLPLSETTIGGASTRASSSPS